jgi:hypothetical protein
MYSLMVPKKQEVDNEPLPGEQGYEPEEQPPESPNDEHRLEEPR